MRKQHGDSVGNRKVTPKNVLGGGLEGRIVMPGRKPAHTPCAHRWARETGQAPCYAVVRTVSPVRVHSPVRYIPAPCIGRARVGIEPGKVGQARCSKAVMSFLLVSVSHTLTIVCFVCFYVLFGQGGI